MEPNHIRFKDFFNEANQSTIYILDDNDHFIRLTWKVYFRIIQKVSGFINETFPARTLCFAIYHNNAFIWDLCNYSLKLNDMIIMGLNHYDNVKQISELVTGVDIDVIVCAADQLLKVQTFWHKSVLVIELDKALELSMRLENSQALPASNVKPYDACEILSTSGTTGKPKFYYFNEQQILTACDAIKSFYHAELATIEKTISWMPLANPFQRILNLVSIIENKTIYYTNDPRKIVHYCKQSQIEYLASIPRFYEKIHEGLKTTLCSIPLLKHYFAMVFKKLSNPQLTPRDRIQVIGMRKMLKFLVKLSLSRQLKFLISGSAPFPAWLEHFFNHIKLPVYQAYGMSESIIPICLSNGKYRKTGAAGKILPIHQVMIKDKEIYVKSPGLNLEYLSTHPDDYFATGDYGSVDEDGFIYLTGRKVDFFKTSTGRRIYPNKMEQPLKQLSAVNFVCIIGENFKYPVAIIDVNDNFKQHYKTTARVKKEITSLTNVFNDYEIPKLIIIVTNSFSIDSGEITSNMKLRRQKITENYLPIANSILNTKSDDGPIRVEFY